MYIDKFGGGGEGWGRLNVHCFPRSDLINDTQQRPENSRANSFSGDTVNFKTFRLSNTYPDSIPAFC